MDSWEKYVMVLRWINFLLNQKVMGGQFVYEK